MPKKSDTKNDRKNNRAQAAASAPAELAAAEIVMNPETGAILHAKNPDVQRDPASLTKLMTAYVILQKVQRGEMKLDQLITIGEQASQLDNNTFKIRRTNEAGVVEVLDRVPPGSKLTVREALTVMMTSSANGVAKALGEAAAPPKLNSKGKRVPGTERDFAREMTRVAHEDLKMHNSSFINASGLNNGDATQKSNLSTARDLAILSRRLMCDFPAFEKMVSTHTATTRVILPDGSKLAVNSPTTNHFVRDYAKGSKGANKDGFFAAGPQKTGYNKLTGGINLLTSAENKDGVRLTSVVLGGRTSDARYAANLRNLRNGFDAVDTNPAYAAVYRGNQNIVQVASVSPSAAFNAPAQRRGKSPVQVARADVPSSRRTLRSSFRHASQPESGLLPVVLPVIMGPERVDMTALAVAPETVPHSQPASELAQPDQPGSQMPVQRPPLLE